MAFWNKRAVAEKKKEEGLAKEAEKARLQEIYDQKRSLTLEKVFLIAGLDYPEKFNHLRAVPVSDISNDPRRLKDTSVYFYWGVAPSSLRASGLDPLKMAADAGCVFIFSTVACDYENSYVTDVTDEDGNSVLSIAFIKALNYIRNLHKARVITVTGSAGKTSTKEMIESVVRQHYRTPVVSKGNNNSLYAIPRNIQKLKRYTNIYLQEVGASHPDVISFSAKQLEADIAVYTNIGDSHIEHYLTREAIEKDKTSLSCYGKSDGFAVINYDDDILRSHKFKQQTVSYSLDNKEADYYASDIVSEGMNTVFRINSRAEGTYADAVLTVPGSHNVLNAVAAYAVGKLLKLSDEEILKGIFTYTTSGIRQNIIKANGFTVIADCYNSSLIAVDNILETMDSMEVPSEGGRKVAVLGDVLELGAESEKTHVKIGETVASHNIDLFLSYGIDIKKSQQKAWELGVESYYFNDKHELESYIRSNLTEKDLILFKASHGVNLGSLIDRLYGTDINESSAIGHKQYTIVSDDTFEYYIFEDSATIRRYLGDAGEVFVPAEIEAEVTVNLLEKTEVRKLPVEKIGKTAFRGMPHVTEVHLPSSVLRIRDRAFEESGLVSFTCPESLISIGNDAFAKCENLKEIRLSPSVSDMGVNIIKDSPQAEIKRGW